MEKSLIPEVSVVMPAFNAEKYLREAIDSILNQTYKDFELIIINDGSTDSTKEIILSYTDPRIVYLENEQNSGICVTLNKGLDAARGKYIARMDSDDISLPERIVEQVKFMDNNPDIGVCGSDIEVFGEGINNHVFQQMHDPEECVAALLFNPCFAHPSVMIRSSILEKHNLRYKDEFRGLEDFELWWQISKYSRLNNIPTPLLKYRHHLGQETKNVCERVKSTLKDFIKIRYSDLGIVLNDLELESLNMYASGNYNYFGQEELKSYLKLCHRIIKNYPDRQSAILEAVQLTIDKSVTYIINNSDKLKRERQGYYNMALLDRVFTPLWFAKVTYHNIFK